MTAFKRSQAKYVRKSYKTTHWPEYEAGLRQRGSLTVWISEDELKGWDPRKRGQRKPGGQEQYSNHAVETALAVGMVFHLGLRQTEGFLRSLFSLLWTELEPGRGAPRPEVELCTNASGHCGLGRPAIGGARPARLLVPLTAGWTARWQGISPNPARPTPATRPDHHQATDTGRRRGYQ